VNAEAVLLFLWREQGSLCIAISLDSVQLCALDTGEMTEDEYSIIVRVHLDRELHAVFETRTCLWLKSRIPLRIEWEMA
jgi:hypothetical protein